MSKNIKKFDGTDFHGWKVDMQAFLMAKTGGGPGMGQDGGTKPKKEAHTSTKSQDKFNGKCHNCGKKEHKKEDCWLKGVVRKVKYQMDEGQG